MKIILSVALAIFFIGCNDAVEVEQQKQETKVEERIIEKKPEGIKHTIAPSRLVTGKGLFMKCSGCHGVDASKKALGKSAVIKGWSSKKIKDALLGYQNSTYGKDMKAVMQGQVKDLNAVDIQILSEYISKL